MPETNLIPAGWHKFNVLRCNDTNTWAKHIKITAMNPNKSREWVLVLNEVKVYGTGFVGKTDVVENALDDEAAVVENALKDLLNDIF